MTQPSVQALLELLLSLRAKREKSRSNAIVDRMTRVVLMVCRYFALLYCLMLQAFPVPLKNGGSWRHSLGHTNCPIGRTSRTCANAYVLCAPLDSTASAYT